MGHIQRESVLSERTDILKPGVGGLSDNVQNKTIQEIGRTNTVIAWNDKGNQQHSEIIQLEIDNRFAPEIERLGSTLVQ